MFNFRTKLRRLHNCEIFIKATMIHMNICQQEKQQKTSRTKSFGVDVVDRKRKLTEELRRLIDHRHRFRLPHIVGRREKRCPTPIGAKNEEKKITLFNMQMQI